MQLWHKFTKKLPETDKELVLRFNEHGICSYKSAMAVEEYDLKNKEYYTSIEYDLKYTDGAYKHDFSCEMFSRFRADKEETAEWCYLDDLCKTLDNLNV